VAARAFVKARTKTTVSVMLSALVRHQQTRQWQRGIIPHPATWLNQERWTDELPQPVQTQQLQQDRDEIQQAIKWRRLDPIERDKILRGDA
jgi:hypothetical protein